MTALVNGRYRTKAGSRVEVAGEHRGIHTIDFDWFEERACIESRRSVSVEIGGGLLVWQCECHGGGQAELVPVPGRKAA